MAAERRMAAAEEEIKQWRDEENLLAKQKKKVIRTEYTHSFLLEFYSKEKGKKKSGGKNEKFQLNS